MVVLLLQQIVLEDALVDSLEKFIGMSWVQQREMGLAGRKKVENEFDRQLVVKAYMEEIERIVCYE